MQLHFQIYIDMNYLQVNLGMQKVCKRYTLAQKVYAKSMHTL